ncbi:MULTISPECIES: TetR/AcrR family transcriptional regulator [Mycobacterium]|uniref:TetR/AcrR family transcriptional regulator n=1 Tax=Mycobacterium TaxID=1763 RepID=UPI001EF10D7A|nr:MULTISPECIES: TetR/AcrR family transcriptional regulator [Mycobacterium]
MIDVALAILDADGLEAVSLRRLSAELGVSHMTLYGYFDCKDALLEALVARTIAVPAIRAATSESWDEVLFEVIQDLHSVLVDRPGIAEILVARELTGGWIADARERILDILRGGGFDDRQATDGISVIFNYLLGAVMIETRRGRGGSPAAFEVGLRYLITGLKTDPP